MRDKISSEDWKEFLDIFPNAYHEIDSSLNHLNSDAFKELMSEELGGLRFIHCRDDEYRSPQDVRDFPEEPSSGYPRIKKTTYKTLVESCCKSPVLNLDSISENSKKYLQVVSNDLFLLFLKMMKLIWRKYGAFGMSIIQMIIYIFLIYSARFIRH